MVPGIQAKAILSGRTVRSGILVAGAFLLSSHFRRSLSVAGRIRPFRLPEAHTLLLSGVHTLHVRLGVDRTRCNHPFQAPGHILLGRDILEACLLYPLSSSARMTALSWDRILPEVR